MLRGALFDGPFTVRNLDNFLTTSGLEKPKMRTEEKKMNYGELDIRFEGATELSQRADLQKLTKYARYMEFR